MLAAVTKEVGGSIDLEEVPPPDRRSGDVMVRVRAASVNPLDRAVYDGIGLGRAASFPLIQGIDAAGVLETGGGGLLVGSQVVVKPAIACLKCHWCLSKRDADCGQSKMFGIHRPGGFAELIAVPRRHIAMLPLGLSFVDGAAAAHSHAVALRMMRAAREPTVGDNVVVTGAGGALGTAAVQVATALGARVVAVASSPAKIAAAMAIGAAAGITTAEAPSFGDAVREVTDGLGADLAIDTTGAADVMAEAFQSLAKGGRLVCVAASEDATLDIDVGQLYRQRQAIIGSAGSGYRDLADVLRLLKAHDVHPVIAASYGLDQVNEAMEQVLDRDRIGKVVIEMGAAP